MEISQAAAELRIPVKSAHPLHIAVRLTDSTGQAHQFIATCSGSSGWETLRVLLTGNSPEHWAGANDGQLHFPLRKLALCIHASSEDPQGSASFADGSLVAR